MFTAEQMRKYTRPKTEVVLEGLFELMVQESQKGHFCLQVPSEFVWHSLNGVCFNVEGVLEGLKNLGYTVIQETVGDRESSLIIHW